MEKVKKTATCWEWIGCVDTSTGYGRFLLDKRYVGAHRVSYELFRSYIPEGLQIDHRCRNRKCVNPDHLEIVTCRENLMRGIGVAAINIRKTHCPQGHPYDEDNTHSYKGRRKCKQCIREQQRAIEQTPGRKEYMKKYYASNLKERMEKQRIYRSKKK